LSIGISELLFMLAMVADGLVVRPLFSIRLQYG